MLNVLSRDTYFQNTLARAEKRDHLLGLDQTALVSIEDRQAVNHVERQHMVRTSYSLVALQRPLSHLLGLHQLLLVGVKML